MKLPSNWSWQSLNDCYVRESGMESKPYLSKEFAWANWSRCGFVESELVETLHYLRREVKANRRKPACMSFRTLIEQPENFEHEYSLAKEERLRRKPPETPRQAILRSAGMATEKKTEARPVRDIIAESKALADLKQWRLENGI